MSDQQQPRFALGKFDFEHDAENREELTSPIPQHCPTEQQESNCTIPWQRFWYRWIPIFLRERSLEQTHVAIFNNKAMNRKFVTDSGSIEALDYREPCLGTSTGTSAAAPPLLENIRNWHWLSDDEIREADDVKSTEGFVPTLKRMLSKSNLLSGKGMASESDEHEPIPKPSLKSKSTPSLPSMLSSRTRSSDTYNGRTTHSSSSKETAVSRRADWSQSDEEPHKESFLKRLFP